MKDSRLKLALLRVAVGLAEFLTPRDWVPRIPLPPKSKGEGVMSLADAIKGFPPQEGDHL